MYPVIVPISPWDWSDIGIKLGTNHVIHRWKAWLSGIQKKYVNKILNVVSDFYDPPTRRL